MQKRTFSSVLRAGGMFTVAFSVAAGLLVTFVLPTGYSITSSLQLVFFGFLNLIGLSAFVAGLVLSRRRTRRAATSSS